MNKNHINVKNICIYSSELATLIGLNPYKGCGETIMRIWSVNYKDDYLEIKKSLKETEITKNETKDEKFKRISNKYKEKTPKLKKTLEQCLKTDNIVEMKEKREEILKECKDMDYKDKKEIEDSIREITNTGFGTKNESKSIHMYTQLTGEPVIKFDRFVKRILFKSGVYNWYLGGKIDGILADNTIIEIKNRMHKLFYKLRDYEKIQTYGYMFIFRSSRSQIVETYLKGKSPEVNMMDVEYEDEFWNFVLNRILIFIEFFNKFINSKKMKKKFLKDGIEEFNNSIDLFT